jgi:excinuclease UvrABC ATPase subunit
MKISQVSFDVNCDYCEEGSVEWEIEFMERVYFPCHACKAKMMKVLNQCEKLQNDLQCILDSAESDTLTYACDAVCQRFSLVMQVLWG